MNSIWKGRGDLAVSMFALFTFGLYSYGKQLEVQFVLMLAVVVFLITDYWRFKAKSEGSK